MVTATAHLSVTSRPHPLQLLTRELLRELPHTVDDRRISRRTADRTAHGLWGCAYLWLISTGAMAPEAARDHVLSALSSPNRPVETHRGSTFWNLVELALIQRHDLTDGDVDSMLSALHSTMNSEDRERAEAMVAADRKLIDAGEELHNIPLMHDQASLPWQRLIERLRKRGENWEVWAAWYDWRLRGTVGPWDQEAAYVEAPTESLPAPYARYINEAIVAQLSRRRSVLVNSPAPRLPDPPPLPGQEAAPYFAVNAAGVLELAPPDALDVDGNNLNALEGLHPHLRELARAAVSALDKSNPVYPRLLSRAQPYLQTIDQPLPQVSFGKLYVEGVRFQNAFDATLKEIGRGELPALSENEEEPIRSLLAIHGSFVLNTATGAELLIKERDYQRRPEDEREYREAASAFASELEKHPEVMRPAAASLVKNAADEIGAGGNPQRGTVIGHRVVMNAVASVVGVATVAAAPVVVGAVIGGPVGAVAGGAITLTLTEALKKTKSMSEVNALLAGGFDKLTHDLLPRAWTGAERIVSPHLKFVLSAAPHLRRLAGLGSDKSWLNRSLDWLERVEREAGDTAAQGEGLTGKLRLMAVSSAAKLAKGVSLEVVGSVDLEVGAELDFQFTGGRRKAGKVIALMDDSIRSVFVEVEGVRWLLSRRLTAHVVHHDFPWIVVGVERQP